jgi:hypothetical protein
MAFETAIVDPRAFPRYQRIAAEARELRALGLSYRRIGEKLGTTDGTVKKAIEWLAQ